MRVTSWIGAIVSRLRLLAALQVPARLFRSACSRGIRAGRVGYPYLAHHRQGLYLRRRPPALRRRAGIHSVRAACALPVERRHRRLSSLGSILARPSRCLRVAHDSLARHVIECAAFADVRSMLATFASRSAIPLERQQAESVDAVPH